MKVLIWLFCLFLFSFVQTLLKSSGILLGGLPTFLLAGAMFAAAGALCRIWDKKRGKKRKTAEPEEQSPEEEAVPWEVMREIGREASQPSPEKPEEDFSDSRRREPSAGRENEQP